MKLEYETDRLIVKLCGGDYARELLRFVSENRGFFAPWEALRQPAFFTEEFQEQVLLAEYQAAVKGRYLRYYLFLKEEPDHIIGTVSFSGLPTGLDRTCHIGYKMDRQHTGCGYAKEALQLLLAELPSLHIHRVEADIMPDNQPSRALAERLGFVCEGVARSSHEVAGQWQDHLRYAYILPE